MKVLFLHQNFPAQFRQLAKRLAQDPANELLALKQPPEIEYPGVGVVAYPFLRSPDFAIHPLLEEMEAKVLRGEAVAEAGRRLKTLGWNPDVIIAHPGWGEALFIKEVWPEAKFIIYGEYYYRPEGQDYNFDPEFISDNIPMLQRMKLKNSVMLHALAEADEVWTPTPWQRSTFPSLFHERIKVVHEGIDTDHFKPNPQAEFTIANKGITLKAGDEVITYAARSLEPVRGFHIFMRALPEILRQRPKAHVIIMGAEASSYGPPPPDFPSWSQKMLAELGDQLDPQRVHIVGFLPTESYREVLQVSRIHVYLTYPFFLSWSMLEAMACGTLIVASDTRPVRDVIQPGESGLVTPFFDVDQLAATVIRQLKAPPESTQSLRQQARNLICKEYAVDYCMKSMLESLPVQAQTAQPVASPPKKPKASPAPKAAKAPAPAKGKKASPKLKT